MECRISSTLPDDEFWKNYALLWKNCMHQSVFQSPSFIRNLATRFKGSILLFSCTKDDVLMAAVFFRKVKNTYYFLSDVKTDHNFFVLDKNLSEEEIKQFFIALFNLVRKEKHALILNKQPTWAKYMPIFQYLVQNSDLYCKSFHQTDCPVLEKETPQAFFDGLNSTELRYKFNRLKKRQGAVYEVFTDDQELEVWLEEFADLHIKRWQSTLTPSDLTVPENRQLILDIYRAWAKDNLLRRFSIRIGDKRIAFSICLQQDDYLIGHAQAFDPEYSRHSPGRVLIYFLGQWMEREQMKKLDFGVGDEGYKFFFSNKKLAVNKVALAHPSNARFIIKTKLINWASKNQTLISFYRKQIKPHFRLNYRSVIWTSCTSLF